MRRLKALQQRQKDLATEGRALADTLDSPTATEEQKTAARTRRDGILAELETLVSDIAAEQRLIDAERVLIVGDDVRVRVGHDLSADKPWPSFGAWLQAIQRAQTGGGVDPRLLQAAATGMNESSGPDGGFAIPVEYSLGIEKTMWETGQILSRVSDRPVSGNRMVFNVIDEVSRVDGSRRGAVLGYWLDEAATKTPSAIKLARVEMVLRKVAALGYMTDELREDAPALEAELTDAFTEELMFQAEAAIINGDGAGKPLGILQAPATVSVAKETNQAAASILSTNLSKMWARLPTRSKANAVWLINGEVSPVFDELAIPVGVGGMPAPFVRWSDDGTTLRIKGRPVIEVEYLAALGTVGDIILADLSQYRVIRKANGVQTASSIHVRFLNDETTYRAVYRIDGQPLPRSAITPYKGSATLSPFVSLATRA